MKCLLRLFEVCTPLHFRKNGAMHTLVSVAILSDCVIPTFNSCEPCHPWVFTDALRPLEMSKKTSEHYEMSTAKTISASLQQEKMLWI